jgi:hypothetical protein
VKKLVQVQEKNSTLKSQENVQRKNEK